MTTLWIDDEPFAAGRVPLNIGEIIAAADAVLEGTGRIVTAVRIDGVEEPAFRDVTVTNRPLNAIERVELESGTPGELALRCLAEVSTGLTILRAACGGAADRFRTGRIAEGNDHLTAIISGAATGLTVAGGVAPHIRFATRDGGLDTLAAETTARIDALIAAQASAEWSVVADLLDGEIAAALGSWLDAFAGAHTC